MTRLRTATLRNGKFLLMVAAMSTGLGTGASASTVLPFQSPRPFFRRISAATSAGGRRAGALLLSRIPRRFWTRLDWNRSGLSGEIRFPVGLSLRSPLRHSLPFPSPICQCLVPVCAPPILDPHFVRQFARRGDLFNERNFSHTLCAN